MRPATLHPDEAERALMLIYASRNAHMWANYTLQSARLEEFCQVEPAKQELVELLRMLADDIEGNYGLTPPPEDDS